MHPSRGSEYPDHRGMAKTEIPAKAVRTHDQDRDQKNEQKPLSQLRDRLRQQNSEGEHLANNQGSQQRSGDVAHASDNDNGKAFNKYADVHAGSNRTQGSRQAAGDAGQEDPNHENHGEKTGLVNP